MATRLVLVFPAVAVGTGATPLLLSWNGTRWRFWRISAVLFLTLLPVLLMAGGALLLAIRLLPAAAMQMTVATPVLDGLVEALDIALGAAAASWLFVGYGLTLDGKASGPVRMQAGPDA